MPGPALLHPNDLDPELSAPTLTEEEILALGGLAPPRVPSIESRPGPSTDVISAGARQWPVEIDARDTIPAPPPADALDDSAS